METNESILAKGVVALDDRKLMGKVKDVVIDCNTCSVSHYIVTSASTNTPLVLPLFKALSIGDTFMTIQGRADFLATSDLAARGALDDNFSLVGRAVYSQAGSHLGTIKSFNIDTAFGKVTKIDLEDGSSFELDNLVFFAPEFVFVNDGSKLDIELRAEGEDAAEQTETAPVAENAEAIAAEAGIEAKEAIAEVVAEEVTAEAGAEIAVEAEAEVQAKAVAEAEAVEEAAIAADAGDTEEAAIAAEAAPEVETELKFASVVEETPSLFVEKEVPEVIEQLEVVVEEEAVEDQPESEAASTEELASTSAEEPPSASTEELTPSFSDEGFSEFKAFLLGKILNERVVSESGGYVVEAGTELTEEVINEAQKHDVLLPLMMSVDE